MTFPLPCLRSQPLTPWSVAAIVTTRAADAGFGGQDFGGHSLKRGAHLAELKRLGRHQSFDVLGEYLEFGVLFARHLLGGVL